MAGNSTGLPAKKQVVDVQKGNIGKIHSSAATRTTAENTGVVSDHNYTNLFGSADEQHRYVLCQTELTLEDVPKVERGINWSSITAQASSQEVKSGADTQR